ncbi:MAG: hypothetical protein KY394_02165 [Actinobacteria bacterium]|nr:hypothetical protein [Actinomycetota bacterium]
MAALLRWMALTFARFVGLAVSILGGVDRGVEPRRRRLSGCRTGHHRGLRHHRGRRGLAYLLSFDGPARFRERRVRVVGWAGMLISVLLPSSLT